MTEATLEAHARRTYQVTDKMLNTLGIYNAEDRQTFWHFLYERIEEELLR